MKIVLSLMSAWCAVASVCMAQSLLTSAVGQKIAIDFTGAELCTYPISEDNLEPMIAPALSLKVRPFPLTGGFFHRAVFRTCFPHLF